MSAGTRNLDLGVLFRAECGKRPTPTHSNMPEKPEPERLRLVGAEDSASLPNRKEAIESETIPPREPGVDLAMLQPSDIDAAKLVAFLRAIPPAERNCPKTTPPASPRKAVVMPLAKTDLQAIFQADKVCMVARPPGNASTLETDAEPDRLPPQAACSAAPTQKTPHFLDKTQQYLVENWPRLPPNVQAAILNVIDAAVGPDDE